MLWTEPPVRAEKTFAPRTDAGGTGQMPVYAAAPAGRKGRRPALLLIQEIFGVNDHIQDVVRRFAAAGYVVASPDLFWRQGEWRTFEYTDFASAREVVSTLTEETVAGDLEATLDYLARRDDVDPVRIGVIGYCLGGRLAFLSAALFAGRVQAAAIYYGGGITTAPTSPAWPVAPVERVHRIRCPVIGFFGALDRHIPREQVEAVDEALAGAGVERQIFYYPHADHGFFCDARASFHPRASQDAWHRTLRFFEAHLGPAPTWPES
jgi:carboxymethylenebutenolidase